MFDAVTSKDATTSGTKEIVDALGGGIRPQSLVIIEGDSGTGKSILSQYISHGILISGSSIVYYSSGLSCEGLIHQWESLNMRVRHLYVSDLLRVYPIDSRNVTGNAWEALKTLIHHVANLPRRFDFIVIDCLTPFMEKLSQDNKIDAFMAFKELCDRGESLVLVAHTHIFEKTTYARVFSMSDYYLRLRPRDKIILPGIIDERNINTLEISKARGIELSGKERIEFEIKPKMGIQILPFISIKV